MSLRWLRYGVAITATTFLIWAQDQKTPSWAYALNPPAGIPPPPAPPPPPGLKHVPGSAVGLTVPQTRDLFNPPDWTPTIIR